MKTNMKTIMKENMKRNLRLGSLRDLLTNGGESLKSLKSLKQIFGNLVKMVKMVKMVMQIFSKGEYSAVRVSSVQQPTNIQRISNLSLTIRPTLPLLVTLVMLTLGVGQAWGGVVVGNVYVTQGKGTVRPDMQVYYAFKGWQDEAVGTETSDNTLGTIRMDNGSTKRCKFVVVRTNPGYTFDGWYKEDGTKKSGDNPFCDETVTSGATRTYTYYARFAPNTYTLTFDKNATDATLGTTSSTVTYDARYDAGTGGWPTPVRTGYTFDGWFTSGGAEISGSTAVTTASNHTLYAHWTANNYTVTLNNHDATTEGTTSVSVTYDATTGISSNITVPTKTDYTFGGYYTGENGTGTLRINASGVWQAASGFIEDGKWKNAGNVTLHAYWILNSKTITLDNQGADDGKGGTASIEVFYNRSTNLTEQAVSTLPIKSGYTFEGYFTGTNGSGTKIFDRSGYTVESAADATYTYTDATPNWKYDGNITLYAYWKQNQTITWSQTISAPVRSTVIDLTASASSSLGITYEVTVGSDLVTLSGSALTCKKAGDVTVVAHQAGNSSWNAAADASKSFTIIEHRITTLPTASDELTYEQTLNSISPTGGVTNVAGSWAWKYPESVPGAGTANQVAVFTPSSSIISGEPLECNVEVTVNKATPDVACTIASDYMVDAATLDLQSLWTREGDGAITYSVTSFTPASAVHDAAVANPAVTSNRYLALGKAGAATIQMVIAQGTNYNARTVTKNITIHKYNSVFAGVADLDVLVDENVTSEYVLTYTKPDAGYVGAANHVAGAPALEGAFRYAVVHDVQTENVVGSPDGSVVIAYNPSTKVATGKNKGVATITLTQDETYKYNAEEISFDVEVSKHTTNVLSKAGISSIYADKTSSSIVLSASENTDYANNPIYVEYVDAVHDPDTLAYTYTADTRSMTVTSNYHLGSVAFHYWQEENYKFTATENTFTVDVIREPEDIECDIFILQDSEYQEWLTTGETKEYSFNEPGRRLYFDAKRITWGGFSNNTNFFAEYSANGKDWNAFEPYITLENADQWYYSLSYNLPENARYVRFKSTVGATGKRAIQNVKVSRRNMWLNTNVDTVRISKTAASNPVYPADVAGAGQFIIDRSLANGGDIRIHNDNSAIFKLSKTTISDVNCKSGKDTIAISYEPTMEGEDIAHLIIYNDVYRDTIVLTGVCVKHKQHGSWKDNISLLQTGVEIANAYTSTMSGTHGVVYTILEGSSIEVDGSILRAVSAGATTIRAYVSGDNLYYDIADTIVINVSSDAVQYIVWDQDYELTHLTVGGSNVTLNAYADSEVESDTTNGPVATFLRPITYSIKAGEPTNVVSVSGNILSITGAGQTILVATQAGGTDGGKHIAYAAASMEQRVYVRSELSPVAGGEYYLYNFNDSTRLKNDKEDGVRQDPVSTTDGNILFEGKSSKSRTTCTFAHEPAYAIIYSKNNGSGKGTVYVDQLVGERWERAWSKTTFVDTWTPDTVQLSRNATQVRAGIDQDKNYIYFGGLKVVMAKYIEVVEDGISKETLGFSTFINTPQTKELQLRYSDVKGNILLSLEESAPFTLNTEEVTASAHDADNVNLRITYKNSRTEENGQYKLTISDGAITREITLNASARADSCQFHTDGDWEDDSEHWTKLPNENLAARIDNDVQITISTEVSVYSLEIKEGASVVVTPTGGLSVGAGGVSGAGMENISVLVDNDPESANYGVSGYVRVSPDYEGTMPHVAMQAYSKAYYDVAAKDAKWQYIGSPIKDNVLAKSVFTNSYIYTWDESQGKWLNKRSNMRLEPFKGYATTQKTEVGGVVLTFEGELVDHRTPKVIELHYTEGSPEAGCNVLANSFAAPIDISRLRPEDFSDGVEATIHLFNTGSNADIAARAEAGAVDVAANGQYISVPYKTARSLHALSDYPIVIPSMQGFYIQTNKPGTVTLDYERLVWEADYGKYENQPLRVISRGGYLEENDDEEEDVLTGSLKMTLYTPSGVDHLILLESDSYSAEFENGYDAHKMMSGDLNIFAVEDEDQLSVDATNSIIGTRVGVRTGESDMYTIAFSKVNSDKALVLVDLEAEQRVDINEGAEYTFFIEPNSTNIGRFYIFEAEAPSVTTGVENASENGAKVHKFIKDDKLYILKNGVLYDATGAVVRR